MAEEITVSGVKLKIGASGNGSITHLTTETLLAAVGLAGQAINVPYDQGRAPVELLAGRLDAAVQWPGQFISHHGSRHVADPLPDQRQARCVDA